MKNVAIGTGLFLSGMLTHKKVVDSLHKRLAKERILRADGKPSYVSRNREMMKVHPKYYKNAERLAKVITFFI